MDFQSPLQSARLIKRYKRFLADIALPDGSIQTIHCANTGAMTGCANPNDTVWYSTSSNPKRKYPLSWELTQTATGDWICINTTQANKLAVEGIQQGIITELQGYERLITEVPYGEERSRIDVFLQSDQHPDCYVEVKSVTLLDTKGQGYFPDAVTTRGQKHLRELAHMAGQGHRAVLLFIVLHSGIKKMSVAHHIDPVYSDIFQDVITKGVEVYCYQAALSPEKISIQNSIPYTHI